MLKAARSGCCSRAAGEHDRHGGRPVLVGTNLLFAASLVGMALAQGPVGLFAATTALMALWLAASWKLRPVGRNEAGAGH